MKQFDRINSFPTVQSPPKTQSQDAKFYDPNFPQILPYVDGETGGWWMVVDVDFHRLDKTVLAFRQHPPQSTSVFTSTLSGFVYIERSIYISQVSIINRCHIFQTSVQCTSRRSQVKEAQRCVDETCRNHFQSTSCSF